jgi:hypothetical protein
VLFRSQSKLFYRFESLYIELHVLSRISDSLQIWNDPSETEHAERLYV